MDGNTRLCTATAATAMRESFGSDGQPGSYADVDTTDCLFIVGHNVAATQTVLWARILDRLHSPHPPTLIVVEPRRTVTAQSATIHLTPRIGTNVALLNGLQHLLIAKGYINTAFVERHTVGYADLRKVVDQYPPEVVAEITGVSVAQLHATADLLGRAPTLLTTALQGVYQSNQATAAACQLNNINLLLGQIGRPGAGLLQMNGQPTAQNNRETGCNGEYPGFRNHLNPTHMADIARQWNVPVERVPHWREAPTHIMEMLSYIEQGSIDMLWVIGTNPLVSLPDLTRVRRLLTRPGLFLVVQDIFMTESAQLADVVLPAAMWGEKTGCFTNADRTCHLSLKAIEPPGQARPDLDIFLDYGRRMGFKDKDGGLLLPWKTPEEVFEAWKALSAGRPCDYSGMSYAKLTGGSGVQWPCHPQTSPEGTERLFTDWKFYTDMEYCESYGHDLETGHAYTADDYRAMNPAGRAFLKSAHYQPSEEMPSADYPLRLATGRNVYHFHTRTKTGRDRHLREAGGQSYVQLAEADAREYGIGEGDLVLVESVRGKLEVRAKVGGMEVGQVFLPFHFGYWDNETGRAGAANELTATTWDPVSKQPLFKSGAVRVTRVAGTRQGKEGTEEEKGEPAAPQLQSAAIQRAQTKSQQTPGSSPHIRRHRHLEDALLTFQLTIERLEAAYEDMAGRHAKDVEMRGGLKVMLRLARKSRETIQPLVQRYADDDAEETKARREGLRAMQGAMVDAMVAPLPKTGATGVSEAFATLRDCQALVGVCALLQVQLSALQPTGAALQDKEMVEVVSGLEAEVTRQQKWATTMVKAKAAQTLIVAMEVPH